MSNRKQRDANRKTWRTLMNVVVPAPLCPNCGKPGPHFVPPIFGEPGFFVCMPQGVVTELLV